MMRFLIIFFLLSVCFSLTAQSKKVKLKLVQYIPYCGGAKPTPEILKASQEEVQYSNKKLIFISSKGKIDTIYTDTNGIVSKKLSYGIYKFFEPWKFYKKIPYGFSENNIQMDCLKEEWAKEDVKITVSKKATLIENNLKYPLCPYKFPCLITKHPPR